jgi:2-dehydro-3-deoxyphosphogluconate aldolase/(4S)-4-hydroxy-2-oxoglutarate aldolase
VTCGVGTSLPGLLSCDADELGTHGWNQILTVGPALLKRFSGLVELPVIGIVRGYEPDLAESAIKVAFEEGIRLIEVTMDSPDALGVIERISTRTRSLVMGVGTVTSVSQVAPAAEAGAAFVVTPTFSEAVIKACTTQDLSAISGAATPTEILNTIRSGASAIKVFPAEQLGGPAYLRAIRAPLGNPPLVPTGGVTPNNAKEYLESGAVAVAAGSSLFTKEVGRSENWETMRQRVRTWVKAVM